MTDLPPPPAAPVSAAGAGSAAPPPAAPRRSATIPSVLGVAVVTVLALGGVIAWGGGEAPLRATPTGVPGGPQGLPSGDGGISAIPGSASASGSGPSQSSAPLPPFDVDALVPPGAVERPPGSTEFDRAWLVPGRAWSDVLSDYQRSFPVPGWELGLTVRTIADGLRGKGYEIQAVGRSRYDGVAGEVVFEPDPDDPTATILSFVEKR